MTRQAPARNEFKDLGERLVSFGKALQDPTTSVGQLVHLAGQCGIKLRLRVVADMEGAAHEQPR